MHILYIHQYFKTPEEGGAIRSYYLAKGMADAGHRVTLITTHNEPKYKKTFVDGIHVYYLPVAYKQSFGFLARLWAFIKFVVLVCYQASSFRKADLCYATSTPLTVGLIGWYLKLRYSIPYYFEVRDLWPEAPVQMQIINNRFLQKMLCFLEKSIYKRAQAIIALSPGIADHIKQIVPQKLIYVLPNISDCQFFRKSEKNPYHEEQFDATDKFVVTYFGSIGKVNHLEYMLQAAEASQHILPDVLFIIAGDGSEKASIEQLAAEKQLGNIRFVPFQNKYGLLSIINITDASYICFADKPVLETSSPNKFFDALAAGKACITTTKGWLTSLVEENQCGLYIDPAKPDAFVEQLAPLINDRQLLEMYKNNARSLAERQFDKNKQVENLLAVIDPNAKTREAKACTLTA